MCILQTRGQPQKIEVAASGHILSKVWMKRPPLRQGRQDTGALGLQQMRGLFTDKDALNEVAVSDVTIPKVDGQETEGQAVMGKTIIVTRQHQSPDDNTENPAKAVFRWKCGNRKALGWQGYAWFQARRVMIRDLHRTQQEIIQLLSRIHQIMEAQRRRLPRHRIMGILIRTKRRQMERIQGKIKRIPGMERRIQRMKTARESKTAAKKRGAIQRYGNKCCLCRVKRFRQNGSLCGSLWIKKQKTVTIPAAVSINGVKYKITAIADRAFKGNKNVTKVKMGSSITKIGKNAFYGCKT